MIPDQGIILVKLAIGGSSAGSKSRSCSKKVLLWALAGLIGEEVGRRKGFLSKLLATAHWRGPGNINSGLGAVFNNLAGATFQKSAGAGITTISVAFDNTGTVLNTSDGVLTFTNCAGCPP